MELSQSSAYPACSGSIISFLVKFARSSWLEYMGLPPRHDFFRGATARVVDCCDMLFRRGRGCCPGCNSLKFTIYNLGPCRQQSQNRRLAASRTIAQCEHAHVKFDQVLPFKADSIRSSPKVSILILPSQFDRINFPSPLNENAFWLFVYCHVRPSLAGGMGSPKESPKLSFFSRVLNAEFDLTGLDLLGILAALC